MDTSRKGNLRRRRSVLQRCRLCNTSSIRPLLKRPNGMGARVVTTQVRQKSCSRGRRVSLPTSRCADVSKAGVLPLGSPSFSIFLLKQKDLAEAFCSGTMYGNVLPHAWSPPNFPHSEMTEKGAPIGSNFFVRTDPSPLAVIRPESMPSAKITSYKTTCHY